MKIKIKNIAFDVFRHSLRWEAQVKSIILAIQLNKNVSKRYWKMFSLMKSVIEFWNIIELFLLSIRFKQLIQIYCDDCSSFCVSFIYCYVYVVHFEVSLSLKCHLFIFLLLFPYNSHLSGFYWYDRGYVYGQER